MSTPGGPPVAGWYDDGSGSGTTRYWDGTGWTDQTRPAFPDPPGGAAPAAPPGLPPGEARTKPHPVAWAALAAAAVGFIFACIPGALIIGWILLPIAFVLAIVAFFLKGKKWPAVTALVLSVLGTVVGFVVFLTVVSDSVDEAFGDSDVSVSTPSAEEDTGTDPEGQGAEDDTGSSDEDAAGDPGSRENPVPLGSVVSGDEYDVTINGVDLDATDAVMAANEFNEAPPEGYTYIVVDAAITYTGAESGNAALVSIDYVTSTGEVLTSGDTLAVPPEPVLGLDELYEGGTATGNTAIAIPAGDAGLLRVRPGLLSDEVFVATQ